MIQVNDGIHALMGEKGQKLLTETLRITGRCPPFQAMGCFPFGQVWAGIGDSLLMNRVQKGKNSKLTVEKPGTHPITRAVKVTVTGDKSCSYHVPRICCNETTSGALPQTPLFLEENIRPAKGGGHSSKHRTSTLQMVKVIRNKETPQDCGTDPSRLNAVWDPGFDPRTGRGS